MYSVYAEPHKQMSSRSAMACKATQDRLSLLRSRVLTEFFKTSISEGS
jgi:hypothetical protein